MLFSRSISTSLLTLYAHPQDSSLDLLAQSRASSIYLPELTAAMLPTGMAEEGISLFQGRENLALTCAVRLRTEGERAGTVEEYRFTPSVLPHVNQCTYAQVDRLLMTGASPASVSLASPPQPFTQHATGQQKVPLDQHAVFEGADGEVRQAAVRRLERLAEMRRQVRLAQGAVDMAIPRPKIKVTRSRGREGGGA